MLSTCREGTPSVFSLPVTLLVMPVTVIPRDPADSPADFRNDQGRDDEVLSEEGSTHTARLYSEVSSDEFDDCYDQFAQEVNQLEREYFDSLHRENLENNHNHVETHYKYGSVFIDKVLSEVERKNFHRYNVTPDRPCSAYFKADSYISAADIFEILAKEGFRTEHVRCLQRTPSGEIFITFKLPDIRQAFLQKSSLVYRKSNRHFVPNDKERPLTFLTICDTPYKLPDSAIIHRLQPYCEVLWYRLGTYKAHDGVFNGLRHYRVRVINPLPSYMRFGKFLIRLYHDGQVPTC